MLKFNLKSVLNLKNNIKIGTRFLSEYTQFGYESVEVKEKQIKVNKVFSDVAEKYDIMNDLMSFGLHRIWKEILIREIKPTPNLKLIDVAGGTGDVAFRYLYYLKSLYGEENIEKLTICDINPNMLQVGENRATQLGYRDNIDFLVSNAENLAEIKDSTYDVYTISFGIRNCTHFDKVLKEAHRVLKKGGRLLVMEFSHVNNDLFRKVYDEYSFKMIPLTGQLVAGDWNSYQYFVESIRVFPNQNDFSNLMKTCGFKYVSYKNLVNGVVAIYSGLKL